MLAPRLPWRKPSQSEGQSCRGHRVREKCSNTRTKVIRRIGPGVLFAAQHAVLALSTFLCRGAQRLAMGTRALLWTTPI